MNDFDDFVGTDIGSETAMRLRPLSEAKARILGRTILDIIFRHRRLRPSDPCAGRPCETCFAPYLASVVGFLIQGDPVHFVLPGFPAKAPNPAKVLGALPDMAERLSLSFLQSVCDEIRAVYPPGALISICSDGRVFGDLVRVGDDAIGSYAREIRAMIQGLGAGSLGHANLEEIFGETGDGDTLRRRLLERHGDPLDQIRQRILGDVAMLSVFNGIHRFLFEDLVALSPGRSRNAVRNESKHLAYQMIQRGIAWSALLRERFVRSVRLSIHPHSSHGEKLGIRLVESSDVWATPWHAVAVDVGGRFLLMKRAQAEVLHATLVYRDGRPSHFALPELTDVPKPRFEHPAA